MPVAVVRVGDDVVRRTLLQDESEASSGEKIRVEEYGFDVDVRDSTDKQRFQKTFAGEFQTGVVQSKADVTADAVDETLIPPGYEAPTEPAVSETVVMQDSCGRRLLEVVMSWNRERVENVRDEHGNVPKNRR